MTRLVGILNVTPDSFSDGGLYESPEDALNHMRKIIGEGAEIVDIGAESTRPGATQLSADQEWKRLEPLLRQINKSAKGLVISLDSRHPANIAKALQMNIGWVNDVSGLINPEMIEAVKDSECSVVLMHNLGIPADPANIIPENEDAVAIVLNWAKEKLAKLKNAGIDKDRIIFDPGIGFGKNAAQSLALIRSIDKFKELGVKILVGHSRKSFLKLFDAATPAARDAETCRISNFLAQKGVDYLRVHNVKDNKSAINSAHKMSLPEGFNDY